MMNSGLERNAVVYEQAFRNQHRGWAAIIWRSVSSLPQRWNERWSINCSFFWVLHNPRKPSVAQDFPRKRKSSFRRSWASRLSSGTRRSFPDSAALWMMRTAIAKVMKQVSPREHQLILGVPFYLFGYKRGCWVTAIDPRLQNLECGYSPLGTTADCIHKYHLFQKFRFLP